MWLWLWHCSHSCSRSTALQFPGRGEWKSCGNSATVWPFKCLSEPIFCLFSPGIEVSPWLKAFELLEQTVWYPAESGNIPCTSWVYYQWNMAAQTQLLCLWRLWQGSNDTESTGQIGRMTSFSDELWISCSLPLASSCCGHRVMWSSERHLLLFSQVTNTYLIRNYRLL